ncbi:uncharacterized protein LOC142047468 [Chelonoidis abingdonii]|uniref:uncharacterized protein LOC142047468 n=1 Tax=Chelonoidis abingdonii TaxID=106734 RepID=UPI003F495424
MGFKLLGQGVGPAPLLAGLGSTASLSLVPAEGERDDFTPQPQGLVHSLPQPHLLVYSSATCSCPSRVSRGAELSRSGLHTVLRWLDIAAGWGKCHLHEDPDTFEGLPAPCGCRVSGVGDTGVGGATCATPPPWARPRLGSAWPALSADVSCPGPVQVSQVDSETVLVLLERSVKIVTLQGTLVRKLPAPNITFDVAVETIALGSNMHAGFWRHGVQVWDFASAQLIKELRDQHCTFGLLGTHSTVVLETRPMDDIHSNLYVQE